MSNGTWTEFNITTLVKAWRLGTYSPELGFMLTNPNTTSASYKKAPYSSEYTGTALRPYVMMTYEPYGIDFDSAAPLSLDTTIVVNINSSGLEKYYEFTPSSNGFYTFESFSNNGDPYARLYNSNQEQIACGCPNTTYGESVGCVAITRNASVITITVTAVMTMLVSFISPFVAFLDSIPGCVMGGVCITLYGFIAVSGLKMIQKVDLEDSANLFTVSAILITGIGGMAMSIGKVTITAIACALILGIIVNIILNKFKKNKDGDK